MNTALKPINQSALATMDFRVFCLSEATASLADESCGQQGRSPDARHWDAEVESEPRDAAGKETYLRSRNSSISVAR